MALCFAKKVVITTQHKHTAIERHFSSQQELTKQIFEVQGRIEGGFLETPFGS